MKLSVYENYNALSQAVAELVIEQVTQKPNSLLCFPAGDTPTGLLKILVQTALSGTTDFSQCYFIGLDELIGLNGQDQGSFRYYLDTNFFVPLNINSEKIIFFDGHADDPNQECQRIDNFLLSNGPMDMVIAGIGMNGHIAMNEPGSDFRAKSQRILLETGTKDVAQKYFTKTTILKEGLTLGLGDISQAKHVILMASGNKKSEIIAKALQGDVTNQLPASIMQTLDQAIIMLDQDAASQLD